ncbi:MAG: hypothetical protein DMF24_02690 [Verrucomicrobia bacterium]|nr:MAG: hypothetical protein DMF24_02690 [Verrucomicrobiota bacterium]
MERERIIFFRNFFFCAFIIGLVFALFYLAATILLWDTAVSLTTHLFKIDEKEFGRLVLLFFIQLRVVIVFFFLVPALALHWMARKR